MNQSGHATAAEHRRHPWLVHDVARDFTLLDVWRIPLAARPAEGDSFADFIEVLRGMSGPIGHPAVDGLFRLRFLIGRAFGWDKRDHTLPIPGSHELSVAERLSAEQRRGGGATFTLMAGGFRLIYQREDEALLEVSNATIHALLHLGWVEAGPGLRDVQVGIYVKSRGLGSDLYMLAIRPFRHLVIYPAFIRIVAERWRQVHLRRRAAVISR